MTKASCVEINKRTYLNANINKPGTAQVGACSKFNKKGTSKVGAISKAQKAQHFFEKNLKFLIFFGKCRTVPKNVKGGPFGLY